MTDNAPQGKGLHDLTCEFSSINEEKKEVVFYCSGTGPTWDWLGGRHDISATVRFAMNQTHYFSFNYGTDLVNQGVLYQFSYSSGVLTVGEAIEPSKPFAPLIGPLMHILD